MELLVDVNVVGSELLKSAKRNLKVKSQHSDGIIIKNFKNLRN